MTGLISREHGEIVTAIRLPGPQKEGVAAAEVETLRIGNIFYVRWSYHVPTTGGATPFGHSPEFGENAKAIEYAVGRILDRARSLMATSQADSYTDTDREWARRIEAWAKQQRAPQQMSLL